MIEFAILPTDGELTNWIETVHVAVSFDLHSCHYSPNAREFTTDEIERLSRNAFRMKCPATGESFTIGILAMSDKVRDKPEAAQKHIRNYLSHPIRFIIAKDIERQSAAH
ncbi:hypothetical protein [Rhizobium sp. Root482]|uniref:hypothetical protein n=1 Tax=Rhizobium sp. Root482 TaxID=1736543 RepID=UPI0006FD4A4F|nr:hypothetical protein [Rhizobium sp. Root482]KQY14438.1 hypothetical protein ASD31_09230 [Rhizobium sp. Root482]